MLPSWLEQDLLLEIFPLFFFWFLWLFVFYEDFFFLVQTLSGNLLGTDGSTNPNPQFKNLATMNRSTNAGRSESREVGFFSDFWRFPDFRTRIYYENSNNPSFLHSASWDETSCERWELHKKTWEKDNLHPCLAMRESEVAVTHSPIRILLE